MHARPKTRTCRHVALDGPLLDDRPLLLPPAAAASVAATASDAVRIIPAAGGDRAAQGVTSVQRPHPHARLLPGRRAVIRLGFYSECEYVTAVDQAKGRLVG